MTEAIDFDRRLAELGVTLPDPAQAIGRYASYVRSGNLFISVQGPLVGSELKYCGRIGADYDLAAAQDCAKLVCLNLLAQVKRACAGDLRRVRRCLRLGGFLNTTSGFDKHTLVMNAASDLVLALFGEAGQHARFVVGCNSLPYNLAMEIEGFFEIE